MFHKLIDLIINLLFPNQCFNCKEWGDLICNQCSKLIPTVKQQRCIECQKPSLLGFTHPKCQNIYLPERLITIFYYQQPVIKQMINTGKLAMIPEVFSDLTLAALSKIEISNILKSDFVLCPVPLSKYKQNFRGFNQSLIIAKNISTQFNLPIDKLLFKNNFVKQQKQLDKKARTQNIKQAFGLLNKYALPKAVILVDDVTTTGSTFKAAAKILKQAGIEKVWCLALAQD